LISLFASSGSVDSRVLALSFVYGVWLAAGLAALGSDTGGSRAAISLKYGCLRAYEALIRSSSL